MELSIHSLQVASKSIRDLLRLIVSAHVTGIRQNSSASAKRKSLLDSTFVVCR